MSFVIPYSCTTIGSSAFAGSTSLNIINMQGKINQINSNSFANTNPNLEFYVNYYATADLLVNVVGINTNKITILSPHVTSISPAYGPIVGGNIVTIIGNNFTNDTSVYFGANIGTINTVSSDGKTISVTIPPAGNSGSVNVIVSTDGGKSTTITNGYYYTGPPPCFHKSTKILTNNGYIAVQNLRKGDLVKTLKHDFVPIHVIGESMIYNPKSEERVDNRLYKCSKDVYPELFDDLIITGMHSILVDGFKDETQKEKNRKTFKGKNYMTDNKYRLLACVDDRTIPYENEGYFEIYSIALDHDEALGNYGIYANGLLVESTSISVVKSCPKIIQ